MNHNTFDDEINLSQVEFIREIHEGDFSQLFQVKALGKDCVLKVYHGHDKAYWEPVESKLFEWESSAYRRFKATGLCQRGIVPEFYGTITSIDPEQRPELRGFRDDPIPPKAVLIEYIPTLERMCLRNYTPERVAKLVDLLDDLHAVRVAHGDTYPRNMSLATEGTVERLLWIDFDRASTYPWDRDLTDKETKKLEHDTALARDFIVRPTENDDPDWLMAWTGFMTTSCPSSSPS